MKLLRVRGDFDWLAYRWGTLLIVPIGYYLSEGLYDNNSGIFLLLNAISLLSLWVLIAGMRKLTVLTTMVATIMLVLLLGYYVKFYLLSYALLHSWPLSDLIEIYGYYILRITNKELLLRSLQVTTYSLLGFSIVSTAMIRLCKVHSDGLKFAMSRAKTNVVYKLILVSLVLFFITSAIRIHFGLIGNAVVVLPMKIAGITNIINSQVVPFLMVIALGYSYQSNKTKLKSKIALLFFSIGVVQFLLFHSKFHIFLPLLSIIIFKMIYGFYALSIKKIIIIIIVVVTIYPFLNVYRRIASSQDQIEVSTFTETVYKGRKNSQIDNVSSSMVKGVSSLLGRIVGLDSLAIILIGRDSLGNVSFWDLLLSQETTTNILTRNMIGASGRTGISEGFLGGLYFTTGTEYGTAFLFSLWTLASLIIVYRLWLLSTPLSMNMIAIIIISVLLITNEGLRLNTLTWLMSSITLALVISIGCEHKIKIL